MTIQEIKEMKRLMESQILNAISFFEDKTKLSVSDINLRTCSMNNGDTSVMAVRSNINL
jgi:hypothetical protein